MSVTDPLITKQGVELAWDDATGYRCPRCSLYVARTKRNFALYCPRCPSSAVLDAEDACGRSRRRILGDDVVGDFENSAAIAGRAAFRLGWEAALAEVSNDELVRIAKARGIEMSTEATAPVDADPSALCRCGHAFEGHSAFGGEGNGDCFNCGCPRFRPAETSGPVS